VAGLPLDLASALTLARCLPMKPKEMEMEVEREKWLLLWARQQTGSQRQLKIYEDALQTMLK